MKKHFWGSLCYQGIRGGAIIINDESVIYRNQTLTLPEAYKNIVIPIEKIKKIELGFLLLLPTVTLRTEEQVYKFVIFNRNGFLKIIRQNKNYV